MEHDDTYQNGIKRLRIINIVLVIMGVIFVIYANDRYSLLIVLNLLWLYLVVFMTFIWNNRISNSVDSIDKAVQLRTRRRNISFTTLLVTLFQILIFFPDVLPDLPFPHLGFGTVSLLSDVEAIRVVFLVITHYILFFLLAILLDKITSLEVRLGEKIGYTLQYGTLSILYWLPSNILWLFMTLEVD